MRLILRQRPGPDTQHRIRATALAAGLEEVAKGAPAQVSCAGMRARRDIGLKALTHAETGKGVSDPW